MKYRIEYPIYVDCDLRCPYCFHAAEFPQARVGGPIFTLDEYRRWRNKYLADAEEIVLHLHGGEPTTALNVRYIEQLIPALDGGERIDLLSNGLGAWDTSYARLLAWPERMFRIGFTYHRRMIGGNEALTKQFADNVMRASELLGASRVYVKELLFLDLKEDIKRARDEWFRRGVRYKVQDFKGHVRGEDFSELAQYSVADMEMLDPEYTHEGEECACLAGYKNIIIRGGWRGGDVLACWIDPCVVGNISDCTYNPSYHVTLDREKGTVVVAGVPKQYRGTYERDRYYEHVADKQHQS